MAKMSSFSLYSLGLVLMVCAASVLGHTYHHEHHRANHNLDEVEEDIEALEQRGQSFYRRFNNITTIVDSAQRIARHIQVDLIPRMKNRDATQLRAVNNMLEMVNALKVKACDVLADAERMSSIATDTSGRLASLSASIADVEARIPDFGTLESTISQQLKDQNNDIGDSFTADLQTNVETQVNNIHANITFIDDALAARRCDYGTFRTTVPGSGSEPLYSDFDNPPHVAYAIIGFVSFITDNDKHDAYSHGVVDIMGFNVTISDVDTDSFDYTVTEIDDETIDPKFLYIRYMACENLDYDGNPNNF